VDLAIIATPAHIVPQIVEECGEAGVGGVIIVSSGFGETGLSGKALEDQILKIKNEYGMRIIGPNCLGVMHPSIRLNATFAYRMAKPGNMAFISQSGALCASILDWASHANVGFSYFVSVGSMLDVDFADLIDYFGADPETRSIVLFVESIKDAKRFMSAARRFAGTKPIIVMKAGRTPEGMRSAASHTGAVTGEDAVYDAAFKRVGVIRVEGIADLLNCAGILAMQPIPKGPRLLIITNAGGPGVMATDFLVSRGGKLASLSEETRRLLNEVLPSYWSRSNPVDICEDATVERFRRVFEICFREKNADGFLVIYTPIGAARPAETAEILAEASRAFDRPILTSWLGEEDVREARRILQRSGIPTYSTPEEAISTFMYMYQYARNLELLYETPRELPMSLSIDKQRLLGLMRRALKEGRDFLLEHESKEFLRAYGIPVVETYQAKSPDEAASIASRIGYPVVMKIISPDVTHKTDVDGVVLNVSSEGEVKRCFKELMERVRRRAPSVRIEGVTVQPMIDKSGYELIIGAKKDKLFGSVLIFGSGGIGVELFKDISIGFPPLNQTLAQRMMEQTRIYNLLVSGFRNMPPANISLLEEILVRFSQMIIEFPQIREADINPLVVDDKEAIVLDARIIIDKEAVLGEVKPYEHLAIRPYPTKYIKKCRIKDGREVLLRPIKPEDEPLISDLFGTFSEETMRFRFFQVIKDITHEMLVSYCNIDYSREMTIVAERSERGRRRILGMARLVVEPDGERGEIAIVVGDPWQNLGLGTLLLDHIIEVGRDMGLKIVFGEILAENTRMLHLCYKRGFKAERVDEESYLASLELA
jgi:acetyltransferase